MKISIFSIIIIVLSLLLIDSVLLAGVILTEDFEGFTPLQKVWPPVGWLLVNGVDDMQPPRWGWGTTPYSGVYNARTDIFENGLVNCGLLAHIFVTVPLTDPILSFYYRGGLNADGDCPGVIQPGDFCTYTQGGWGAPASGHNPGTIRDTYWDTVYSARGSLVIGPDGCNQLIFTGPAAVEAFLPCGGPAKALDRYLIDPLCDSASGFFANEMLGILAAQVTALRLNVDYSCAGVLPCEYGDDPGEVCLGDLIIASGPFAGLTVRGFLMEAEEALCCGDVEVPGLGSFAFVDFSDAATDINENFVEGIINNAYLECPVPYEVGFAAGISTTRPCPSQYATVWDSGLFNQPGTYEDYVQVEVDLYAYAGQGILVGFGFYHQDSYLYPLQLDDVRVGNTSYETLFEGFEDVIEATGFPPVGWSEVVYSGTGNWMADDSENDRPPGSMGYYAIARDRFDTDFDSAMLTPSMDLTGIPIPGGLKLEFDHLFKKWSMSADRAEVSVYSGGSFEETLAIYSSDLEEHVTLLFDPSGYTDPSDVQIEFYYSDGGDYTEEWAIDNIEISTVILFHTHWLHNPDGL